MQVFRLAVHYSLFKSAVDHFSSHLLNVGFLLSAKTDGKRYWAFRFLEGDDYKMVSALCDITTG